MKKFLAVFVFIALVFGVTNVKAEEVSGEWQEWYNTATVRELTNRGYELETAIRIYEQAVFFEINSRRELEELTPFRWDDRLANAAREHSQDLAEHNRTGTNGTRALNMTQRAAEAGWVSEIREVTHHTSNNNIRPAAWVDSWWNHTWSRNQLIAGGEIEWFAGVGVEWAHNRFRITVKIGDDRNRVNHPRGEDINGLVDFVWKDVYRTMTIPQLVEAGYSWFEAARVLELAIFHQVNMLREEYSRRPVVWDQRLADAARAHSEDMAMGGFLSHIGSDGSNSSQRAMRLGWPLTNVSEIAHRGMTVTHTAEFSIERFYNSPRHRRTMLGETTQDRYVGVGLTIINPGTNFSRFPLAIKFGILNP